MQAVEHDVEPADAIASKLTPGPVSLKIMLVATTHCRSALAREDVGRFNPVFT